MINRHPIVCIVGFHKAFSAGALGLTPGRSKTVGRIGTPALFSPGSTFGFQNHIFQFVDIRPAFFTLAPDPPPNDAISLHLWIVAMTQFNTSAKRTAVALRLHIRLIEPIQSSPPDG